MVIETDVVLEGFKPIIVKMTIQSREEFDLLLKLSASDISIPEVMSNTWTGITTDDVAFFLNNLHQVLLPWCKD